MPNTTALRQVHNAILKNPESLDMSSWGVKTACGTTLCIAGHALVTVAGYTPVWEERTGLVWNNEEGRYDYKTYSTFRRVLDDEDYELPVGEGAREYLGLTRKEAGLLFHTDAEEGMIFLNNLANGLNIFGWPRTEDDWDNEEDEY